MTMGIRDACSFTGINLDQGLSNLSLNNDYVEIKPPIKQYMSKHILVVSRTHSPDLSAYEHLHLYSRRGFNVIINHVIMIPYHSIIICSYLLESNTCCCFLHRHQKVQNLKICVAWEVVTVMLLNLLPYLARKCGRRWFGENQGVMPTTVPLPLELAIIKGGSLNSIEKSGESFS